MKVKEDISVRQTTKEDNISEEKMVSKMHAQYQYMYNQRRALINESSVFDLSLHSIQVYEKDQRLLGPKLHQEDTQYAIDQRL